MKKRPKDELKEGLLKKVEESCQALIADVEQGSSEKLEKMLSFFASRAHRWSANNLMMVLAQKRDIGKPVTIKEARSLGHTPKPGAVPAHIFVPVMAVEDPLKVLKSSGMNPSGIQFVEKYLSWCRQAQNDPVAPASALAFVETDPRSKSLPDDKIQALADKLVTAVEIVQKREAEVAVLPKQILFFKAVPCVYDLGVETTGPEISVATSVDGDAAEILAAMKEYAEGKGWKVKNVVLSKGEAGYAAKGGTIGVAGWTDDATAVCTLSHEMAHQLLHFGDERKTSSAKDAQAAKALRELQAEAVSFAVTRHFGIENSISGEYLRSFGATPKDVMSNLSVICRTSREIIEGVSAKLKKEIVIEEPKEEPEDNFRYFLSEPGQNQRKFSDYETLMAAITASKTPLTSMDLEVYHEGLQGSFYHERTITADQFVGELFKEFVDRASSEGIEGYAYRNRGDFQIADSLEEVPEWAQASAVQIGKEETVGQRV